MNKPIRIEQRVKFHEWNCIVEFSHYLNNNRISIALYNADPIKEDGYTAEPGTELILIASTNLVDEVILEDEVAIKNYSENDGIMFVLIHAKIISPAIRHVPSGHANIPICKLLINPFK